MEPQWLKWAKELQAIAQIGLTYSTENPYDVQRYQRIRELAAEILAAHSPIEQTTLLELFHRETGYATPKVDVRGVVFRDRQILLVQEREDQKWTLPGGWADVNESAREVAVREIWEESGYETVPLKLLAVYDRSKQGQLPALPFHVYKFFIHCELVSGSAQTSLETMAVDFFAADALPELSTSRVTQPQILRMFEHARNPHLPTDFD